MTISDIFVWFTLATPIALTLYVLYRLVRWAMNKSKGDNPAPLKDIRINETKMKTATPQISSMVWRVYRSIDGVRWVELDPALTERSACNYATYIKRLDPQYIIRVNDPDGLVLFYE